MLKIVKTFNILFVGALLLLVSINSALSPTSAKGDDYLAFAEKMPEPVGGLPAIYSKIKYPDIAVKAGIQGKVYILAFVDESGNVNDVKVLKGIGGGCDEAAVEAVRSTKFNPGSNKGKAVKVKLSLTIKFELS